jgi:hypothetical protein
MKNAQSMWMDRKNNFSILTSQLSVKHLCQAFKGLVINNGNFEGFFLRKVNRIKKS